MKLLFLLPLLIALPLWGMGQTKRDSAVYWVDYPFNITQPTPNSILMPTYLPSHFDTTKVWFKEAEIVSCRCLGIGDTIIEHWRQGFICREILSSSQFYFDEPYIPQKYYLYNDRKTKVTNQIIYSISRK